MKKKVTSSLLLVKLCCNLVNAQITADDDRTRWRAVRFQIDGRAERGARACSGVQGGGGW
jgi:hypothetical protein